MDRRLIARYVFRDMLNIAGMAAALFWPAGRFDWPGAWAALAVSAAWLAGMGFGVFRHPGLAAERLDRPRGGKPWDAALVSATGLATLVRYIVAGFDQRNGWTAASAPIGPAAQAAALAVGALGYAVFVWAVFENPFFSHVVRVQADRGHTVAAGGPYQFVRHPAYAGAIAYEAAVSIALASWPALAISAISVGLLVARTALEDGALRRELEGYADYASRTRFRLFPGIW